jgi:ketosteroid isomerase-like protein
MASANLDLVRMLYATWERGDFSSNEWADSEIEFVIADGPEPGRWTGLTGLRDGYRTIVNAWDGFHPDVSEFRQLDEERILVTIRFSARGKASGLEIGQMHAHGASLLHVRGGKITKLVLYFDRERALADLGLTPEGDPASE